MLVPFMFPKGLIMPVIILPIDVHEIEQVCPALGLKNLRDICVCSIFIAELYKRPIAVVWPEPTNKGMELVGFFF